MYCRVLTQLSNVPPNKDVMHKVRRFRPSSSSAAANGQGAENARGAAAGATGDAVAAGKAEGGARQRDRERDAEGRWGRAAGTEGRGGKGGAGRDGGNRGGLAASLPGVGVRKPSPAPRKPYISATVILKLEYRK